MVSDDFRKVAVEIYPREGTETAASYHPRHTAAVEIYPREGTETSGIKSKMPDKNC